MTPHKGETHIASDDSGRERVRTPDTGAVASVLTVAPVPEPDQLVGTRDDGNRRVMTGFRPLRRERRSSRDAMFGGDRSRDTLPRPASRGEPA